MEEEVGGRILSAKTAHPISSVKQEGGGGVSLPKQHTPFSAVKEGCISANKVHTSLNCKGGGLVESLCQNSTHQFQL